jgi:hypothetical protein
MNYKDAPNVVVENFFTEDQIKRLYDIVENTTHTTFQQYLSYISWHIQLPQDIVDEVTKIAEGIVGEGLVLAEYNFSRYQKIKMTEDILEKNQILAEYDFLKDKQETSDNKKILFNPLLYPHIDEAFAGKRFTVDVQLKSNVLWDIVVDNWKSEQSFTLKDNQALTFSGTHQVHWRPKKDFNDGEFLDALFLHFVPKYDNIKSEEEKKEILNRKDYKYDLWDLTPGSSENPKEVL